MFKKLVIIAVLSLLMTPMLFGDGLATTHLNFINDLVGAKAAAMGGAYTAISDDPSGAYYNPAGIAYALHNQISLSVNSYKNKTIEMKDVIFKEFPYTQETSSFYPSFFGVVHKLGKIKFAFTLMTKNNELLDQDNYYIQGVRKFNINYNLNDSTALYNLSGSGFITDNLTWGVTLTGLYRRSEQINNQTVLSNTHSEIINNYITEDYYGVKARIGLQWMPTKNISLGISAEVGTILSFDRTVQSSHIIVETNTNFTAYTGGTYDEDDAPLGLPINVRIGFAYFPNKKLLLSADIIADFGYRYYREYTKEFTINGALGMEYYLTPTMPIRFGLFSNMANTHEIILGTINEEMHVDLYGASMGIAWETRNSSISITGTYQYGKGEAVPGSRVVETVVNKYTISLTGTAKY